MNLLLILLTFFSCSSSTEKENKEKCEPILQKIINKQKLREVARKDFQITINWYTQGKISEDQWVLERDLWLNKENQLLKEVNKLYETSYKIKCLE